jgi:ribokinase
MDLVITTPKIPKIGETVIGCGFMTAPGGKGANQAVAAARLGGNVGMIGCVGDDLFGRNLIDNLRNNGVNTDNIKIIKNQPTGVAVITIYKGNNSIIVNPGANGQLSAMDIEKAENIIKESTIVVIQLEIPLSAVERAIQIANKHHVKVLLNPAPAAKLSDTLLSMVDIITPNESECEQLTGVSIRSVEHAKFAVEKLINKGIKTAVVTLGSNGAVYNSTKGIRHKSAYKVEAVDTTAAGDSFTGALAVSLSKGENIDTAVEFASIVGMLTVTKMGAQTSLPLLEEVERFYIRGNSSE